MKIIIGLGNPGEEYLGTRHNAGMMLVDEIAKSSEFMVHGWTEKKNLFVFETPKIMLVKTAKYFMNESDKLINDLRYMSYDLKDLYLAHDDLDIKLGEAKIHLGKGPKVHNGVNAVEGVLGTKEFWRIRIGIDNREPSSAEASEGEKYVLQKFSEEERKTLNETLERIINELFS